MTRAAAVEQQLEQQQASPAGSQVGLAPRAHHELPPRPARLALRKQSGCRPARLSLPPPPPGSRHACAQVAAGDPAQVSGALVRARLAELLQRREGALRQQLAEGMSQYQVRGKEGEGGY